MIGHKRLVVNDSFLPYPKSLRLCIAGKWRLLEGGGASTWGTRPVEAAVLAIDTTSRDRPLKTCGFFLSLLLRLRAQVEGDDSSLWPQQSCAWNWQPPTRTFPFIPLLCAVSLFLLQSHWLTMSHELSTLATTRSNNTNWPLKGRASGPEVGVANYVLKQYCIIKWVATLMLSPLKSETYVLLTLFRIRYYLIQ